MNNNESKTITEDWRSAEQKLRRVGCGLPSTDKEKSSSEAVVKRGRVFRPWFDEGGAIIGREK